MKLKIDSHRFLIAYSAILTVALALVVFVGAARSGKTSFDEIDVQRINVVEPDGTVRLVLSNKARFPGLILKGTERPHPNRKTAGLLFFDDEGTENGGLTFGGARAADGKASAYGHLSFDQYDQDQVITIDASEDGGNRSAGIAVWDQPDYPIEDLVALLESVKDLPEGRRNAERMKFLAARGRQQPRLSLGKSSDGSVSLRLNDPKGRQRLILEVAPDGAPCLRFLGEDGKETARFPPAKG